MEQQYVAETSTDKAAVDATNTANGPGVWGEARGHGQGVLGTNTMEGTNFGIGMDVPAGIFPGPPTGPGVEGYSKWDGPGVKGTSTYGHGVTGEVLKSTNSGSSGVYGRTRGSTEKLAAGVKGNGGKSAPGVRGDGRNAPGVLGVSTNDVGVEGRGSTRGVVGVSENGTGVLGVSATGAGGVFNGPTGVVCAGGSGGEGPGIRATSTESWGGEFKSTKRGQIRLVPHSVEFATSDEGTPHPKLPISGRPGEMITVTHEGGTCSLWLCVKPPKATETSGGVLIPVPAAWAQVQLGTAITGQG